MKHISLWVFLTGFIACTSQSATNGDDVANHDIPLDSASDGVAKDDAAIPDSSDGFIDTPDVTPRCPYTSAHLIPGPCQAGFDAALERKAFAHDRQFHLFNAVALGVNTDITVDLEQSEDRAKIEDFLKNHEGWDFEAFAGKKSDAMITTNHKVAGLYAGMGILADAFRYGTLRDQGYPAVEVNVARQQLLRAIETMHIAQEITGVEGVIARGLAKKVWGEHGGYDIVPLFDATGNPLPAEKNNGCWRADNSGKHPDLIWEDSISRDMLIGWAAAMAAVWEVIRDDGAFDAQVKERMKANARALAKALMVVRPSGYDMEVPDADGRTTLHGYLNEHNIDGKIYNDMVRNGFHAIMGLGIVAAYAYICEDPEVEAFLNDKLIAERDFPGICLNDMMLVDMGVGSNYSNYNMAFTGAWLVMRYVRDETARDTLRQAIKRELYARPGQDRQPSEIKYSLYDFVYAAAQGEHAAWRAADNKVDLDAVRRGVETLQDYAEAPYWDYAVINCPEALCDEENPDVANPDCIGLDGTPIKLLGCVGRNGDLVAAEPIPWRILGPSNYHWRSNPYIPNRDGNGSNLLPGVDFRAAYWMGRYVSVTN